MINICPYCHNYDQDKMVSENKKIVKCPKCGGEWASKGLPLFILTGCSGVGKTTTAMELMRRDINFIVLDADYFVFMPSSTTEEWVEHIERMNEISADIMQCGKPVLWTMAGCIDRLHDNYYERFFNGIYCLALVCDEEKLERRMKEGRNIHDENWINGSKEYNRYLCRHDKIGDVHIDKLDISDLDVLKVADRVNEWVDVVCR